MKIRIRKATLADIPVLKAFEQGVVSAERPYNSSIKEDITYYDLLGLINSVDSDIFVAVAEDKIVGSGYVRIKSPERNYLDYVDYGYLGFMYIDPDYRGNGINKLIMNASIEWAKKTGLEVLHLDVYAKNTGAIKAYKKVGFTENLVDMKLDLREVS